MATFEDMEKEVKFSASMLGTEDIEGIPYIKEDRVVFARPEWWGKPIRFTEYGFASEQVKIAIARILDIYPKKIIIEN